MFAEREVREQAKRGPRPSARSVPCARPFARRQLLTRPSMLGCFAERRTGGSPICGSWLVHEHRVQGSRCPRPIAGWRAQPGRPPWRFVRARYAHFPKSAARARRVLQCKCGPAFPGRPSRARPPTAWNGLGGRAPNAGTEATSARPRWRVPGLRQELAFVEPAVSRPFKAGVSRPAPKARGPAIATSSDRPAARKPRCPRQPRLAQRRRKSTSSAPSGKRLKERDRGRLFLGSSTPRL